MLRRLLVVVFVLVSTGILGCPPAVAAPARRATRVLIKKKEHTLTLLAPGRSGSPEEVLATYSVALGPGGAGPKKQEGDKVTPVGRYHVTAHQPSQYKVFLRLDYPTPADFQRFTALKQSGALPKDATIGGDIGIHGPPVKLPSIVKAGLKLADWTLGCIAVDDDEITEIASMVRDGTPVDIED